MTSTFQKTVSIPYTKVLLGAMIAVASLSAHAQNVRLMPMGDSITVGYNISTGAGYRGFLWADLVNDVDSLNFVGSRRDGNIGDPDNEGHSGWFISDIASIATGVLTTYRPNIVTLDIGTNDTNGNRDVANAPARLGALIDQIFAAAPDTTLLVGTLIPAANADSAARMVTYNARLRDVVQARANAGKHIAVVDMSAATKADLQDGLHPNDTGYRKMADAWSTGVKRAIQLGWVKDPVSVGGQPSNGAHVLHPQNAPGMAMDDLAGNTKAGNPIVIWSTNNTGAQSWLFSNTNVSPAGSYNIAVSYGPYCLTASGSSSGAAAQLQSCNGSAAQAWKASPSSVGYTLHPANNDGLCLDVKAADTKPGTLVQVWTCNGTKAQQWEIK